MNISYIKEISQLDWRCRQFLFLYFIRAISAGMAFFIGMYLSILSNAYFLTFALCLIRTIGEMIITVLSQYLCFQYAPKSARGKAMGHHKLIFALGVLLGSFTSGNLMANFGVNAVWDVCGLLGAMIMLLCVFINQRIQYHLVVDNM